MSRDYAYVPALWRHKATGNEYMICRFALIEATQQLAVVYCRTDIAHPDMWVRPASEFFDGRFELVLSEQPRQPGEELSNLRDPYHEA